MTSTLVSCRHPSTPNVELAAACPLPVASHLRTTAADWGRRLRRQGTTISHARKVQQTAEEQAAGQWAALAAGEDKVPDEKDPELLHAINEVCNHGLQLMLRGETHRLAEYQDELSRYGQAFTDRGNMAGAVFIYVLYRMSEHILPKEMLRLEGIYLQAFEKLHGLLEDSGWQLKSEPKEGEELELDEEPSEEQLGLSGYMG